MNELRKLLEGGGGELRDGDAGLSRLERALLNAGVAYRGSMQTRTKALTALGFTASMTVPQGVAAAASGPAPAMLTNAAAPGITGGLSVFKLGVVKVAAALSLTSTVVAVPVVYQRWNQSAVSAVVSSAVPEAAEGPGTAMATEAEAAVANPLSQELAAVDAARVQLSRGQPLAALSALDTYGQAFPRGRLELEAEVLRITALSESGRAAAASKRAEAFVRAHPGSVLAQRVRGYLRH